MRAVWILLAGILAGCATPATNKRPADAFFGKLQALCGKAFAGRLASTDAADAEMAGAQLVMHVRQCSADEIRIPFHVGDDRSRTWIITRTAGGLRLKHDHRHKDGTEDELTMYGGDSVTAGSATRQAFPVDGESIALFTRTNRSVSNTNVWAVEVNVTSFAYELRRPPMPGGRFFRVEFDLTRPIAAPPPPWGH